jgi:hypothetical protein
MTSEVGNVARRSNKSWSFGCKPSPREAAIALNSSKDVISKPPVPVASQDQHELLVVGCHSESCSQIGTRELEAKKWSVLLRSWKPDFLSGHLWVHALVRRRRHREEPPGLAFGEPDDRLRDEAIRNAFAVAVWIASLRSQ